MQPDDLPSAGSTERWLLFAETDLVLAKTKPTEDILLEALCFHAQQAVEKALKAVLVHFNIAVPKTHSIEAITDMLAQEMIVPDYIRASANLTPYAGISRYPGDYEPATDTDLRNAIEKVERVLQWARKTCGKE